MTLPLHDRLMRGIAMLAPYIELSEFSYVANSFPNGTPNHPKECYYCISLEHEPPAAVVTIVTDLGWEYDWSAQTCMIRR